MKAKLVKESLIDYFKKKPAMPETTPYDSRKDDVYNFADAMVEILKSVGFDGEVSGYGRDQDDGSPIIGIEIERFEYSFKLAENNDVILVGTQSYDGRRMSNRDEMENLGELNSPELIENLEKLLI